MPVHLREQLHAAAERSGRSINAELVHRLERSLAREQSVFGRLRQRQGEGSMQRRTLRRWSIAAGVLASAMIVGLSALVLNGRRRQDRSRGGAAGRYGGASRRSEAGSSRKPGHGNEGPSRPPTRRSQRAFPDSTISLAAGSERATHSPPRRAVSSRAARATRAPGSPSARARRCTRDPVPELVQLRAERVRRGRPHDVDRHRRHVQSG